MTHLCIQPYVLFTDSTQTLQCAVFSPIIKIEMPSVTIINRLMQMQELLRGNHFYMEVKYEEIWRYGFSYN